MKGKILQGRILYLAKLLFRFDEDKQKLKEFSTIKPALWEMLKGLFSVKKKRPQLEVWKLQKENFYLKRQINTKCSKSTTYEASKKVRRQK